MSSSGAVTYAHNVVYGVGKAAVDKMTADMAVELAGTGVEVVSLWPGLVRTEMLDAAAVRDGDEIYIELPGEGRFDLTQRRVAAVPRPGRGGHGRRPRAGRESGKPFTSAGLARELGFTDTDGRIPEVLLRPDV